MGFLVSGGDRKEKEEDLIFRGGLFGLKKENVRKGCKRKGSRELKKRREGFVWSSESFKCFPFFL